MRSFFIYGSFSPPFHAVLISQDLFFEGFIILLHVWDSIVYCLAWRDFYLFPSASFSFFLLHTIGTSGNVNTTIFQGFVGEFIVFRSVCRTLKVIMELMIYFFLVKGETIRIVHVHDLFPQRIRVVAFPWDHGVPCLLRRRLHFGVHHVFRAAGNTHQ